MSLSSRSQTEPQWSTGVKAPEFPFSAATNPRQAAHSSGLDLRIHLEPPVSGRDVYCTSETLRGTILVTRQMGANSTSPFAERDVLAWIRSLSVRFQCESRSMFWTILDDKEAERRKLEMQENVPPSSLSVVDLGEAVHRTLSRGSRAAGAEKKKKKSHKESVRWSLEPEWARATFGEVSLVANGAVQVAGAEERWDALALPFQVALPTEIAFDEWSHFPEADRSLHRDLRPAPPSARDPADASVEWIVEAVLDLRWASRSNLATPLHLTPTHSPTASIASVSTTSFDQDQLDPWRNSRGLLLSKPSRLVSRTVVSVVPADARSLGHDLSQECVPGFAEQERMALRSHAGRATSSSAEAHRHSSTWTRVIELRTNALGTIMGHLTAELVTHKPLYLPLNNLRGSLSMYLDWNPSARRRFALPTLGRVGGEGIKIESATLAVDSWSWTRGGNGKVKKASSPICRLQVPLSVPLSACQASAHTAGRYKVRVPFDLRDPCETKNLLPSFKTPNVEREYTMTVSLRLSTSDTDYYVGIVPLQLTSGLTPVVEGHLGGIVEGSEDEQEEG